MDTSNLSRRNRAVIKSVAFIRDVRSLIMSKKDFSAAALMKKHRVNSSSFSYLKKLGYVVDESDGSLTWYSLGKNDNAIANELLDTARDRWRKDHSLAAKYAESEETVEETALGEEEEEEAGEPLQSVEESEQKLSDAQLHLAQLLHEIYAEDPEPTIKRYTLRILGVPIFSWTISVE